LPSVSGRYNTYVNRNGTFGSTFGNVSCHYDSLVKKLVEQF
jgi:hypothetical protein